MNTHCKVVSNAEVHEPAYEHLQSLFGFECGLCAGSWGKNSSNSFNGGRKLEMDRPEKKEQINHESTKTREHEKRQYKFRAFKISRFRDLKIFSKMQRNHNQDYNLVLSNQNSPKGG